MASIIGVVTGATTSVTPTTHAIGDLMTVFAYRTATTAPTLPSGFTNIANGSGNAQAYRVGQKVCTATNDASGTWTNATGIICIVTRGYSGVGLSPAGQTNAAATTANIPAMTLANPNGNSTILTMVASKQTTAQGTPSGMSLEGSNQALTGANMSLFGLVGTSTFTSRTSSNTTSVVSTAVSIELLINNSINTLSDPFTGTSINSSLWSAFTAGSATMSYTTTGAISTMPASTTATSDADITSILPYDMTGSGAYVHVLSVYAGTTATDATFAILSNDGTQLLGFQVESGVLYAQNIISGTQNNLTSVTYSATTHAWWRVRESGGTIFWDVAPDDGGGHPGSWSNMFSQANPLPQNQILNMYGNIGGSAFQVDTSPGTFKWVSWNYTPGNINSGLFFSMF